MVSKTIVGEGANFLDDARPGWYREIDTDRFSVRDTTNCIGGQLCGSFGNFLSEYNITMSSDLGFSRRDSGHEEYMVDYEWEMLDRYWLAEINARLALDAEMETLTKEGELVTA